MSAIDGRIEECWYLEQINIFEGLSEADLADIARLVTTEHYGREAVIYSPEDEAGSIYLLEEGKVKLSKVANDGKEITIAVLQGGDVFGELSMSDGETYEVFAEVLEDARVCIISRDDFSALVREKPEIAMMLIRSMSERLRRAESQIEDLVFRSVPARVAHLMMKLADEHGRVSRDGITIDLRLTHQDIANMVGATRETVTNVLNDLRNDNIIEIEQKRVRIVDQHRLEEAANIDRG
ncbi:MAG: Crp/Fnr family transcriptional regulator [Armatimonadota bacterium]